MCVEMESAGAMTTGHMDAAQRNVLAIPSISDFADDRKATLDRIGGGALRRYAMENAIDFSGRSSRRARYRAAGKRRVDTPADDTRIKLRIHSFVHLHDHTDEDG